MIFLHHAVRRYSSFCRCGDFGSLNGDLVIVPFSEILGNFGIEGSSQKVETKSDSKFSVNKWGGEVSERSGEVSDLSQKAM
jgi:hypothetical protein